MDVPGHPEGFEAERARAEVRHPPAHRESADEDVARAFLSAARGGDLDGLLRLLAPGASVAADAEAVAVGAPARIGGRGAVAEFFDGAAGAAVEVTCAGRPGAAWFHRGRARVVFDVTVVGGLVQQITVRAAPAALARVERAHRSPSPPST